ncbi:hypothetical protein ACR52_14650 [Pseudomonas fildesensis]|jgi:hypothetical protein|uniref:Uncharacterized protein n=1 Tax=Pseudomonas fildesensis TaxID=1674920 RepID=A0A0J8FX42_9PSED|nr:hypothetical protein ACR52_14650 [Pseudomonas fildesensis]
MHFGGAVLGEDGLSGRQGIVDISRLGIEPIQTKASQVIGSLDFLVVSLFVLNRRFFHGAVFLGKC